MLGAPSRRNEWLISAALILAVGLVLGLITTRLSGVMAMALVLASVAAVAVAYRPELGMLLIVIITSGLIDFEQLPLLRLGPASLHITDAILIYLLLLVLIRGLALPGFRLVGTPLDLPVALFYLAVILSAVLAVTRFDLDPQWVLRRLRPLTYYLAFFAATNLIRSRRQLYLLVNGMFVVAVLASLAVLLQAAVPSLHLVRASTQELVTATQEYQGVLRAFLQADRLIYPLMLVSLASLILGGKWLPATLELVRFSVLAIGLVLTFQRNYWATMLAMIVVLAALVPWPARLRLLRWASVAAVLLILLLATPGLPFGSYVAAARDRLLVGTSPETLARDPSLQMREMEYRYAIPSVVRNPILGVGLGNEYRPFTADDVRRPAPGLRWYAHNAYLWTLIMTGLVGFIPFVWLYATAIARGLERWREIASPQLRVLLLGSTLGILGQAITNLVAPNFLQSWSLVVFPILLATNEVIYHWERIDVKASE